MNGGIGLLTVRYGRFVLLLKVSVIVLAMRRRPLLLQRKKEESLAKIWKITKGIVCEF